MHTEMKKISSIIMALAAVACLFSCRQEEPVRRGQLPEDPLGPLVNVKMLPGNGRFVVNGSVRKVGPGRDVTLSVREAGLTEKVAIDFSTPLFTHEFSGLSAGTYTVSVVVSDPSGQSTDPEEYSAIVFDESSKGDFTSKSITDAIFNQDLWTMTLKFDDKEVSSLKILYKNEKGEDVEKTLDGATEEYVLSDWLDECEVYVISVAKPYPDAVDELELAPSVFKLPFAEDKVVDLDNYGFAHVYMPSDVAYGNYGGNAVNMLTNTGNGFHSNGGGNPCHVTADLGVEAKVAQVYIRYRGDFVRNSPRRWQVWGHPSLTEAGKTISDYDVVESGDNDAFKAQSEAAGWILVAEYEVPESESTANSTVDAFPSDQSIRYLRFRSLESWGDPYCHVPEMRLKVWKKSLHFIP